MREGETPRCEIGTESLETRQDVSTEAAESADSQSSLLVITSVFILLLSSFFVDIELSYVDRVGSLQWFSAVFNGETTTPFDFPFTRSLSSRFTTFTLTRSDFSPLSIHSFLSFQSLGRR